MNLRLHDTPAEVALTANLLREHDLLEIVNESRDYKDRPPSQLVRRYLEIRL